MSSDTPTINMAATGANIKALIKNKGLKVADVQIRCGFNTPQAIFKWMRGDAMPTIDNMVILAHLLDVTIDKIIILNAHSYGHYRSAFRRIGIMSSAALLRSAVST